MRRRLPVAPAATLAALALLAACEAGEPAPRVPDPFERLAAPQATAPSVPEVATPLTPQVAGGAALPGARAVPLPTRSTGPRIETGIFPGTGEFVGPGGTARPALPRSLATRTPGGDVELSFVGADVREVARVILADILDLPFAVDPAVAGSLTLETNAPIPRSAVLPVFEAALRLSNLAVTVRDGLYVVTPSPTAARGGLVGRGQPGYGTEVLAPRYVGVAQLRRLLEPMVRDGQLNQIEPSRNLMLVTGTEAERRSVREMVAQFDVDWMRGMSFAIYAARRTNARRLAEDLNLLIGGEGSPVSSLVRIVPLERLNAVLAISPQPRYLRQLQTWAERLDREGGGDERQVFVYRVQNGRASDLSRVLSRAFGASGGGEGPQPGQGGAGAGPGGLFPGGSPFGAGTSPGGRQRGSLVNPLSAPLDQVPLAQVEVPLQNAPDATPFAATPGQPPGAPGATPGQPPISITSDDTNNAIVIVASGRQFDTLRAALVQLDVLPLQVMIEAAVAEVSLNNSLRFGLQWALTSGQNTAVLNQRSLDPAASTTTGSTAAINALRGALLPRVLDATVPVPVFPNFSYIYSAPNITVVLEALDQITDVNVLSAPQLLVLNNQTASLQVGDQVPVQTQSAQSVVSAGAPLVSSLEYRDTGVILRVTPRVNESGLVLLDIAQEVSSVVPAQNSTLAAQLSPTIQQRRLASSVAVQDGQTIALGGLIRDARNRTGGGVPLLSDIPVLGYLFGRTGESIDRTELLVLLTPRVVRSPSDSRAVTEELRARMRDLRPAPTPFPVAPGSRRLLPPAPRP